MPYGVRHVDMPCTPSRVWHAIQGKARAAAMIEGLGGAAGPSSSRTSACRSFPRPSSCARSGRRACIPATPRDRARRRDDRRLRRRRVRRILRAALLAARARDRRARCCCGSCPATGEAEPGESVDGAVVEHNPCLSGGSLEIFLEPQLPAPRVIIVGVGADRQGPRAAVARSAGYAVIRGGRGGSPPTGQRRRGDRGRARRRRGARAGGSARGAGVPYVALVASTARGAAVREALEVPRRAACSAAHARRAEHRRPYARRDRDLRSSRELIAEHHHHPGRGVLAGSGAPVPSVASALDPVCGMTVAVTDATAYLDAGDRASVLLRRATAGTHTPLSTSSMVPRASRVPAGPRVTGLVLAAGGSKRLGPPKQLLPYGRRDAARPRARHRARVRVRPAAVRDRRGRRGRCARTVDFSGVQVVENQRLRRGLLVVDRSRARRRRSAQPMCSC